MFKKLLVLAIGLFSISLSAQKFEISGKLIDKENKAPLEAATVFAESVTDSTLVTYTITDKDGEYKLIGRTGLKEVNVYVSFVGYVPHEQRVKLAGDRMITLDPIALEFQVESLGDVLVKARRAPVTIKKDTLEFNAESFKTQKDATVEDLLKELPGVEVDAEGNITVNGKPVNKILVNGKSFFGGDDPTIATRNLTKEMISKIQVSDTKSDSDAFTGENSDGENKTINITIDEDKNKGVFGRVSGGGGTDDRFEYAGLVNYFDNDLQLSALGGGNNINSPGFSFGEIEKMFGGGGSMMVSSTGAFSINGRSFGFGSGIINSRTGGLNFADSWGETSEISADYFYSGSNSYEETQRERENILPDNRYFTESYSRTEGNTDRHQANLKFTTKPDTTWFIDAMPSFSYTKAENSYESNSRSFNENGDLINESESDNQTFRDGKTFGGNFNVNKRWANGASLSLRVNGDLENNDSESYILTSAETFGNDGQSIDRNQFTDGEQENNNINSTLRYRLPIVKDKFYLNSEIGYGNDSRDDRQYVYDLNDASGTFDNFNIEQSTDFENINEFYRPEFGLDWNTKKANFGLDVAYVYREMASSDNLRDFNFSQDFNALEYNLNVRYTISQKMRIYSSISRNNEAPQVRQLSPYVDVSDPLNIIQGNPDLKPSNSTRFYVNFNNYDFQTRSGLYAYLSYSETDDQVVSRSQVDENFVRSTTYDNVDGAYRFYGSMSYSKDIELDTLSTIKVGVSAYGNVERTVNYNNDQIYDRDSKMVGPTLNFTYELGDFLELRPSYGIRFNTVEFDINALEDYEFTRHELRLRTKTNWPENLEWSNDLSYFNNPNVGAAFQQSTVLWNSTLTYSILDNKGNISLKAFDILDQNTNTQRQTSENYVQDVQSTVLQQYFMLGFSYKFNTLGKKGEVRESNFFF
ncbi:Outer membrane receptor proteins, mostly Fe transport [Zunongwangia mangrovi]|uniref:Outer membrane receptor proteins, mostly Fe transport n=1 Tax=Zunongwangia mangrovi TaxID=1334022 RepID=A0A1I1II66_9FLAO|nr:outer membrane beta-barrel protein [Zunongwangia mangrovi]SFC32920.1 Outer membrane receptor proteins, mostly Fe transport [Zunongwangia mangrovi]